MKPLPFDMTPLAQSLSLAPASRIDLVRPDRTASAETSIEEPVAEPHGSDRGDPDSRQLDAPEPTPECEPHSSGSEESGFEERGLEESGLEESVETPPAQPTDAETPRKRAKERKARNKRRRSERAKERAAEASVPIIPANSGQATSEAASSTATRSETSSTPTAATRELRTATYPRHLRATKSWASQLAQEQVHALATHILARHTQNQLRTLAITSALAGEGKTTLTLALGEKLAAGGKRIIILDLDTHRATLSREAGLEDAAGALQSSNPRDAANMEFHAYATDRAGVTIMPVGYQPAGLDGPPLLSPVHIGVLVLNAIEDYDIVLLDCPPLLPVADTHVLREVVDGALIVVKAGSTPKDMIDQAIDDFGREKFIGAVLNRAKPKDIPYFREVYGYYRRDSDRG